MKHYFVKHLLRYSPLWLFIAVALAGCATAPDVSRFSDATTQLYVTVQTAGDSAIAEVTAVDKAHSDGNKNAARVTKGWLSATQAAKAVADYSDSLRALVESGENGKANAQKAINSVDSLIKSVASAYPGGEAGEVVAKGVFDGLASLYGAASRALAAKKLAEEIREADPFIQKVAEGLSRQFIGLAQILRSSKNTLLFAIEDKYAAKIQYLNLYDSVRIDLLAQATKDGALTTNDDLLNRWQWAEKMVQSERQQPWYQDYKTEVATISARLDAEIAVAEKAPGVINAWAASHKNLVTAIQQNRSPNFAVLVTLSQDLLATYEQTRAKVEQIKSQPATN